MKSIGHIGKQTAALDRQPKIISSACTVGKKEGEGPLRDTFDYICGDSYFGETTWEKAESAMLKSTLEAAVRKAGLAVSDIGCIFAGDLLNQCTASSFGLRDSERPLFGLYGACSTMAESLSLAAMAVSAGYFETAAAVTGSHFCSAERQFRMPLEYGGQRTPTAQWTVTGSGCAVLSLSGSGPCVTHVTPGKIVDPGVKDVNNMGAAMAPAACDTLLAHFNDTSRGPDFYDLILTGDLGLVGSELLREMLKDSGAHLGDRYNDCGLMIFDRVRQDVHSGGSGCGCSASVLCGKILNGMRAGVWKNVLFAATGALMSPVTSMQGESIPGICCALALAG